MTAHDATLDESLPVELIRDLEAVAGGRELSVVERLFLHGVRVVDPAAARRHMRREWWKAELKLCVWPVVFAAIAGGLFLAMQLGPFGASENVQIVAFEVEYFGFFIAGVFALISALNSFVTRPRWVEDEVITTFDLPPVARGIPAKVKAALGDGAELYVDRLVRLRVLDPGLRVVMGGEQHYLLFYDQLGLPVDLAQIDPFELAAAEAR